jgi:putative glycosyltransferase (TIGR04372 family)
VVTVANTEADLPASLAVMRQYSEDNYTSILSGRVVYFWEAASATVREWEDQKRGPIMAIPPALAEKGRTVLAKLGVPDGAWFVGLHVRERNFRSYQADIQNTLNADINTYFEAIRQVVDAGGYVIRMGDPTMCRLPAMKGVIDYAHSAYKAEDMDIFLCALCRFFLGTSSGPLYVPGMFGRPSLITNWFPVGKRPWRSTDIYIPKKMRWDVSKAMLSFGESFSQPLGQAYSTSLFKELAVEIVDNSSEEIVAATREALAAFGGGATHDATPSRMPLRDAFEQICRDTRTWGNAAIAESFLTLNQDLVR